MSDESELTEQGNGLSRIIGRHRVIVLMFVLLFLALAGMYFKRTLMPQWSGPAPHPGTNPYEGTPISAGPATITVDPAGEIKTIQQAVNAAKAGDVIQIKDGTYREAVTIRKWGSAHKPITIVAQTVGGVVIDAKGLSFGIDGASASHIVLKGVKILNARSDKYQNAALRVGANWVVEDVDVIGAASYGIYIGGSDSVFRRVYARDCGSGGWWTQGADRTRLIDCGATGNNARRYDAGWETGGVKFITTNGVVVDGGVWAYNGAPAIWFDYQNKNFTVRNTEVYANHGWGKNWAGAGIVSEINEGPGLIENNYVHDNTGDGIAVWEAIGNTIRDNGLANDSIGFRDLTSRGHYRTRNNQILNNTFCQGQVSPPPANAKNVVSGNTSVSERSKLQAGIRPATGPG